jgi:hypothetical protein
MSVQQESVATVRRERERGREEPCEEEHLVHAHQGGERRVLEFDKTPC